LRAITNAIVILACATTTGDLLAQGQVHVSPTGSDTTGTGAQGNPYRTVAFAASVATSGDTLLLSAGEFDNEQVILSSKNLTVVGAGSDQTILKPDGSSVVLLPAGYQPGTPTDHRAVFIVDGTARLDLRDLTLDCDHRVPPSGRLHGAYFRNGADGTLENVHVTNASANPLDASQRPAGVYVRGDNNSDQSRVVIRGCRIDRFGKAGIVAIFNAGLEVGYTKVFGAGPLVTGPAQIGIQVSDGAVTRIRHSVVTDLDYTPITYAAAGIMLYNSGNGSVIEGNDIARCEESILLAQVPAASALCAVRNNRCTGASGRGIRIDGQASVNVGQNVLHLTEAASGSPAWDTTTGVNTWTNNNYSDWPGTGFYTIPGSGNNIDSFPRRGCDEFARVTPTVVPTLGIPADVVTADLDGVNQLDIATINNRSSQTPTLSIRLENNGSYGIQNVGFGLIYSRAVAMATGEFDGNPGVDIVVITTNIAPATILDRFLIFTNDGSGGFTLVHSQQIPAGSVVPSDVAVGDIDGNGLDDLTVAHLGDSNSSGGATVYQNLGGGTSWSAAQLAGPTDECKGVAMGPVESGFVDIVVTEGTSASGSVRIYRNDGAGNFTESSQSPVALADDPTAVELLDTDVDGDNDIIVTSTGAGAGVTAGVASIISNQFPSAFVVKAVATDRQPIAIAIGDVAALEDPVVPRPDAMTVNAGGGTLTNLGEFTCGMPTRGSLCPVVDALGRPVNPAAARVAHMTPDGLLNPFADLVIADSQRPQVIIMKGVSTAREEVYGYGCPGDSGRVPLIWSAGLPGIAREPNPTFAIRVSNAAANAPAALMISAGPAPSLAPCGLMLDLNLFALSLGTTTSIRGEAIIAFPIPFIPPSNAGIYWFSQWGVLDPQGQLANFASLTQGLWTRIGI